MFGILIIMVMSVQQLVNQPTKLCVFRRTFKAYLSILTSLTQSKFPSVFPLTFINGAHIPDCMCWTMVSLFMLLLRSYMCVGVKCKHHNSQVGKSVNMKYRSKLDIILYGLFVLFLTSHKSYRVHILFPNP